MKKLILISLALFLSKIPFAQCHSEEEVNNMPTSCKKAYSPNFMPTKEQEKWLTDIYTSAIEPSISKTKGLRGDWNPEGNYKVTPEGYTKSGIDMYMNLMGCHDNKIYNKYIGMVLVFKLNGFIGAIDACTDELDTIIKNKRKKLDIKYLFQGQSCQYLLNP